MDDTTASFAELFDTQDTKKIRHLTPGQKITATIAGISGESVFLDIGGKSEGVLDATELREKDGTMTAATGDQITVYFLRARNAEQLFTTRVGSRAAAHLEDAWHSGIPVEGTVKAEIKGGFEITLGGTVRAFCPYSQIGLRRLADLSQYLGQTMNFRISRFSENGRNIVVSARALQEEEQAARREELRSQLKEGQTVEGVVTSIRDFGVFVDIGGADGLIPLAELGWGHNDKATDAFQLGQSITTVVKKLDWEHNRISLSYKETLDDPWQLAASQLSAGAQCQGTVARLTPFGAFVTIATGVDGLLHVSRLGTGRKIHHPREVLEVGQMIDVRIEEILVSERRISLAPADYVSPEKEENAERDDFTAYQRSQHHEKADSGIGSLGALLQAKLAAKQKK